MKGLDSVGMILMAFVKNWDTSGGVVHCPELTGEVRKG